MLTSERKCRRFSHIRKQQRRDRTGWLGREDSNLGIAGVAHMLTATTTADSQAYDALAPDLVAAPRQNNRHLPRPVKRRLQILPILFVGLAKDVAISASARPSPADMMARASSSLLTGGSIGHLRNRGV